jgi:hypothetical protein
MEAEAFVGLKALYQGVIQRAAIDTQETTEKDICGLLDLFYPVGHSVRV